METRPTFGVEGQLERRQMWKRAVHRGYELWILVPMHGLIQ